MGVGFIGSLLAGVVLLVVTNLLVPKLRRFWAEKLNLRMLGLRWFMPLSDTSLDRTFGKKMLECARGGDEILIIGRTLRRITEISDRLLLALQHGLNLKILILDPEAIKSGRVDLFPLQVRHTRTIEQDLDNSMEHFEKLCERAKRDNVSGKIDVRLSSFLVLNSVTSFKSDRQRRLIYDFSLDESRDNKFMQYYECDPADRDQFANRLHAFYEGLFDIGTAYVGYDGRHVTRMTPLVKRRFRNDLSELLEEAIDFEPLRDNAVTNLLWHAYQVLSSAHHNTPPPPPLSVQLELTNRCSSRCSHCKRHTWSDSEEMTTSQLKILIDELYQLRVKSVTVSGGEPTCRSDLEEILSYARSKQIRLGVISNGVEFTEQVAKAIVTNCEWVRISLDASNKDDYGRIRGDASHFESVMKSLNLLREAREESHADCRIGTCYAIQNLNAHDVSSMVDLAGTLPRGDKDNPVTFKFVHGNNGFRCHIEQVQTLYEDVLSQASLQSQELTNLDYLKRFIDKFSSLDDIAAGKPLKSYFTHNTIRCFTPYLFALVDAVGDVYPCCFLYYDNDSDKSSYKEKREAQRLGNVLNHSFSDIWRGDNYNRIRRDLEHIDVQRYEPCGECTRHYQLNIFLTRLMDVLDNASGELDRWPESAFNDVIQEHRPRTVWL